MSPDRITRLAAVYFPTCFYFGKPSLSYVLLGTSECHLCDQAAAIVTEGAEGLAVTVYIEDITDIEGGVDFYGLRIPVLRNEITGEELNWPFTALEVRALFSASDKESK